MLVATCSVSCSGFEVAGMMCHEQPRLVGKPAVANAGCIGVDP